MQEAFQRCARDCSRINFVHLAAVVDVERLRAFRRDLREKFTKLFAETEMRSDDRQRLRIEVRHVHCVTDRAFEQHGADRLGNFNAHALLRLRRRRAEMRRKNNIGRIRAEANRPGSGSISKTSSAAPATWPLSQRLRQRRFINQTAASAIDDADAALCLP